MSSILQSGILIRFMLFMLSQWGWWCFFNKHSGINRLFLPSLTACSQITLLACFGMIGLLSEASSALLIFGSLYLLYSFIRKLHPFKSLSIIGTIYLLCMVILTFIATNNKVIRVHDDFAHWATVLKELLVTNHFPDKSRIMTEHFTYPLGSAIWIYYFAKPIAENSESIWMFGQALLMVYCIMPMFCYVPKHSGRVFPILYFLSIMFFSNCFLVYNTSIDCLMVDTELPLVGAVATLFVIYNDHQCVLPSKDTDTRFSRKLWYLIPYLCTLTQIKASGIFFIVAIALILLFKRSLHAYKYGKIQITAILGAPLIVLIMWRVYCSVHFSGMTAKHDGSISSFLTVLSQKSLSDISTIFYKSAKYFLASPYIIELVIVLVFIVITAFLILDDHYFAQVAKIWGFLLIVYVLYSISTIAMYIFSMPLNEALELATIDRYQKTIIIYCYYLLFCSMLYGLANIGFIIIRKEFQVRDNKSIADNFSFGLGNSISSFIKYSFIQKDQKVCTVPRVNAARVLSVICIFIVLISGWCYKYSGRFPTVLDHRSSTYLTPRLKLEAALKDANVPQRAKCLVLTTKENRVYRAMLALLLGTDRNDTTQITIDGELDQVDAALQEDTWVIIVDTENQYIKTWLSERTDRDHIVIVE